MQNLCRKVRSTFPLFVQTIYTKMCIMYTMAGDSKKDFLGGGFLKNIEKKILTPERQYAMELKKLEDQFTQVLVIDLHRHFLGDELTQTRISEFKERARQLRDKHGIKGKETDIQS